MELITQILWACSPAIFTGAVLAWWNRRQTRRDEDADKREADRLQSEQLRISLLMATAKLSYALAMAKKRGYPNGEVEAGIAQYEEAMKEFKAFERKIVAEKSAND